MYLRKVSKWTRNTLVFTYLQTVKFCLFCFRPDMSIDLYVHVSYLRQNARSYTINPNINK